MADNLGEIRESGAELRGTGIEIHGPAVLRLGREMSLICVPKPKEGIFGRDKVLVFGPQGEKYVAEKQTYFGRADDNDIKLKPLTVSREHGYLQPRRDGVFYVHDGRDGKGSTNGTRATPIRELPDREIKLNKAKLPPFVLGQESVSLNLHKDKFQLTKDGKGDIYVSTPWGERRKIIDANYWSRFSKYY